MYHCRALRPVKPSFSAISADGIRRGRRVKAEQQDTRFRHPVEDAVENTRDEKADCTAGVVNGAWCVVNGAWCWTDADVPSWS